MNPLLREWGGVERVFALNFGLVCDLEEACGKVGIGEIYTSLATHRHFARYVWHTIRFGLVGGGLSKPDADQLLRSRFDEVAFVDSIAIALDLLIAINEGVSEDRTVPAGDAAQPIDLGPIFANFAQVGIGPDQVRSMRYSDFVNLLRALGGDRVQPPTEDEFEAMVARYEELTGDVVRR